MLRLAVLLSAIAFALPAASKEWPPLPADGFVSGRATTPEDIKAGRAVCSYDSIYFDMGGERPPGRPLENYPVPQYAWLVDDPWGDNPNREPVIIIQAELWGEDGLGLGIRHFDGRLECAETFYVEPLGADRSKLPKLK
ncbi:MAG: hypothetical protein IT548_17300 [Alphaproteobacteria bacterium]|nr:hypothetical protein [Alphaproteobacteria bacterium]